MKMQRRYKRIKEYVIRCRNTSCGHKFSIFKSSVFFNSELKLTEFSIIAYFYLARCTFQLSEL